MHFGKQRSSTLTKLNACMKSRIWPSLANMQATLRRTLYRSASIGRARPPRTGRARRSVEIRYSLPMGKAPIDIADVLNATIERWYGTAEALAAAAGVSGSAVSRWSRRVGRPTAASLEKLAPYIKDDRGRLIPLSTLMALTFPGTSAPPAVAIDDRHPLATELARMLAADSPIPANKREILAALVTGAMDPYRTYMRRRKAG